MSHPQSRAIREYARQHGINYTTALRMVESGELALDTAPRSHLLASRVPWLDTSGLTPRQQAQVEQELEERTSLGSPFWEYLAATEPIGKVTADGWEGKREFVIKRREEQIPGWVITTNPLYVSEAMFRAARLPDHTKPSYAAERRWRTAAERFRKAVKRAQEALTKGRVPEADYQAFVHAREQLAARTEQWHGELRKERPKGFGLMVPSGWPEADDAGPDIRSWPLLLALEYPWGDLLPSPALVDEDLGDDGETRVVYVSLCTGQEIGVELASGEHTVDADGKHGGEPGNVRGVTDPMLDDLDRFLAAWAGRVRAGHPAPNAIWLTLGIGRPAWAGDDPDLLGIEAEQAQSIAEGRESAYGPWEEWRDL